MFQSTCCELQRAQNAVDMQLKAEATDLSSLNSWNNPLASCGLTGKGMTQV